MNGSPYKASWSVLVLGCVVGELSAPGNNIRRERLLSCQTGVNELNSTT